MKLKKRHGEYAEISTIHKLNMLKLIRIFIGKKILTTMTIKKEKIIFKSSMCNQ